MDFLLSDDQKLIADTAQKVGERFGLELLARPRRREEFPDRFLARGVRGRALGAVALPEQYGGAGLGMQEMALIVETLSACGGGSTVGQLFMINPIFGGVSLARFGSDAMKSELLPKLVAGEINFCMALTEPDAGSNSLEIKTFAARDGNGWRLNGRKIWITAVDAAQKMLVVARTTKSQDVKRRTDGLSMFIIDVERKGLTFAPIEKLGTNTLSACSVFFEDVHIDGGELVGTLDKGWHELLDVLNTERIVTTAGLVGAGTLALRQAVAYANERRVFGDKADRHLSGNSISPVAIVCRNRMCAVDELQGGGAVRPAHALWIGGQHRQAHRFAGGFRRQSRTRCKRSAAWDSPRRRTWNGYGATRACSASPRSPSR